MGASCMGKMAHQYVKRPCACFWGFLVFYLLLSFLGAAALLRRAQAAGQTSVFSDGTSYGALALPYSRIVEIVAHRSKEIGRHCNAMAPCSISFVSNFHECCSMCMCFADCRLERVGQAIGDE